jgi:hypothetical protein
VRRVLHRIRMTVRHLPAVQTRRSILSALCRWLRSRLREHMVISRASRTQTSNARRTVRHRGAAIQWLRCVDLERGGVRWHDRSGATNQGRALRQCHSDGCANISGIIRGMSRRQQGWAGCGETRSGFSAIRRRMGSNMVAPIGCGLCETMGAPVMLLDHVGLLMCG